MSRAIANTWEQIDAQRKYWIEIYEADPDQQLLSVKVDIFVEAGLIGMFLPLNKLEKKNG